MRNLTKTAAVVAAMTMMTMGTIATANASELKNTWNLENGAWYYYDHNGNRISNQWAMSGNDWYFLGDDCKMVTNAFINNDTKEVVEGTDNSNDDFYYVDGSGKMVANRWMEIDSSDYASPTIGSDKDWYFFGVSGVAYADQWVKSGEDWYYLNDDCKMADNQTKDEYYLMPGGKMLTGWYKTTKDDGKNYVGTNDTNEGLNKNVWVYADPDGTLRTGWVKVSGKWYWLGDAEGNKGFAMLDDSMMEDGTDTFYLKKNSGEMATGYTKVAENEFYLFDNSKGNMVKNKFTTISNKYYYFGEDGISISDKDKDNHFYIEEYANNGSKVTATGTAVYADMDEAVSKEATKEKTTYKIYKLGSGTVKTVKNR